MSEFEKSGRARTEASAAGKADALALPADPERITARMRLLNASSVLFVLFLLVNLLPDVTKKGSEALYAIVPLAVVEAVVLAVSLTTKKRATRDTVVDVSAVVYLAFGAWLLCSAKLDLLPQKMFPAPGYVLKRIVEDWEQIWEGIGSSLGLIGEGFLLGGAVGIVIGLALGANARSCRATEKVVTFLAAIPPIVYIPYGIALLPTFRASSLLVIFLATLWPTLTATLAGVRGVEQRAVDSARVLGVKGPTMLFRVILPASLPFIFNGLNMGLCMSFILLTSAEMIGGNTGMGYYVKFYSDYGDYSRILASIIVIGVVICAISVAFAKIQQHLTRWK